MSCSQERDLSEERTRGESLEAENQRLREQAAALKNSVALLEERLRTGTGGDYVGLAEVRGQYEALLLEQKKWQASKDELEQLNALLRQQLEDVMARHDQAQDGLRSQREAAVEKTYVLDREKQAMVSNVSALTDELDRTQQSAERALGSQKLKRQMAESQVETLTVENQQLRERLQQAQAELDRLHNQLAHSQNGNSSAAADLERLKTAFGAERNALQSQISTLEQELRILRQENSNMQLQLDDSLAENRDLHRQLEELKKKLVHITAQYEECLPRIQAMKKQLEDEAVKYLQLLKKYKMYKCISIYTLYVQMLTIMTFKRWKEWSDEQVIVRGAAELHDITENAVSPTTSNLSDHPSPKFDDFNIQAIDIHSMADEFGLGIDN